MKAAKKVTFIILIASVCGIWCYASFLTHHFAYNMLVAFTVKKDPLDLYSQRWEITFPEDAEIEYRYSNQGGWFGEGNTYTVIKFETRPDKFLQSFENQKSDAHSEEYSRITNELLEEGMDENRLIALSDEFLYKRLVSLTGMDILILAYDENTDTLYYFEELK